jgi:2-haloacid dehalogenase
MIVSNPKDARQQSARPSILVFDVNEALLDVKVMAPLFARIFGGGQVLREQRVQLVLYSNVVTPSGGQS